MSQKRNLLVVSMSTTQLHERIAEFEEKVAKFEEQGDEASAQCYRHLAAGYEEEVAERVASE